MCAPVPPTFPNVFVERSSFLSVYIKKGPDPAKKRSWIIQGRAVPSCGLQKGSDMVRSIRSSEVEKRRNSKNGVRVNNSKTKKKQVYFTHRQIFLITVMLIAFMGSGIGYVWSNFEGTQIGYDLSRLQQKELRLKDLNQKLRLELATLKSPQNIEGTAHLLGLREASAEQIIVLK